MVQIVTANQIKHLARYFGILGLFCFLGYFYTGFSHPLLTLLGPSFFLAYGLRTHAAFVTDLIPDTAFFNSFFLVFPVTIVYFGFAGFWLKNIINEKGRIRIFVMAVFFAFLIYIHYLAFQEISLYWAGSQRLT